MPVTLEIENIVKVILKVDMCTMLGVDYLQKCKRLQVRLNVID